MKDKLLEILRQVKHCGASVDEYYLNDVADHLLANGVIVQKQGEWKITQEPLGWKDIECVECSACHELWICEEDFEYYKEFWKYCPNCGAKLKEREGK